MRVLLMLLIALAALASPAFAAAPDANNGAAIAKTSAPAAKPTAVAATKTEAAKPDAKEAAPAKKATPGELKKVAVLPGAKPIVKNGVQYYQAKVIDSAYPSPIVNVDGSIAGIPVLPAREVVSNGYMHLPPVPVIAPRYHRQALRRVSKSLDLLDNAYDALTAHLRDLTIMRSKVQRKLAALQAEHVRHGAIVLPQLPVNTSLATAVVPKHVKNLLRNYLMSAVESDASVATENGADEKGALSNEAEEAAAAASEAGDAAFVEVDADAEADAEVDAEAEAEAEVDAEADADEEADVDAEAEEEGEADAEEEGEADAEEEAF